jgi:pyruvate dehydrogenase E2 component (dihydrolipoamide acetyltransferase)
MSVIEVKVPDVGDFKDIPVIEVLVKPGDTVKAEDSLITLESDKATMDVPSPAAGVVKDLKIGLGDKVSEGDVILTLEPAGEAAAKPRARRRPQRRQARRHRCQRLNQRLLNPNPPRLPPRGPLPLRVPPYIQATSTSSAKCWSSARGQAATALPFAPPILA